MKQLKRLDSYIQRCIKDAFKAVGKEYNSSCVDWFYVVADNQLIFRLNKYKGIERRVLQRLSNNIEKNFGLTMDGCYDLRYGSSAYHYLDVCRIKVYDSQYYLSVFTDESFIKVKDMNKRYHGKSYEEGVSSLPDLDWKSFKELHKSIYGEYPRNPIRYASKNVKMG